MHLVSLIVSSFVLFLSVCVAQNGSGGSGMSDVVTIIHTATIPSMMLPSPTSVLVTPTASLPTPSPIIQSNYITNRSEEFVGTSCSCDLLVGSCDPNCCCDKECEEQIIRAFTDCVNHQNSQDDRSCISSDAIAQSSLSLRSKRVHGNSGDLFCVYQDNNPSREEYGQIDLITSEETVQELLLVHSQPGDLLTATTVNQNGFYKVGDPIVTTTGDRFDNMILPRPLNSGLCNYRSPVGFLQSDEVTCVHYMTSQQNWCMLDETAIQVSSYTNPQVLKLPPPNNDTVSISTVCYSLNGDPINCSTVANVTINGSHCDGVLVELVYHLTHNGTDGIVSVNAMVTVDTVALETDRVDQTFAVQFSQVGETYEVLHRSGNRGYQFGQPILAGNVDQNIVLLNVDPSQWLRVANSNQNCQSASSVLVLFGEDMDTSCDLVITRTTDCNTLRTMATNFFTQYRTQYIGSYGDSNPEDLTEWVNVIGYNESQPEVGSDSSTSCDTVTTTQLVVLYGFTGSATYPNVRIFGARYSYITETVTAQCSGLSCQGDQHISLTTHVSFVEISEPPSTLLKSTTNIVRRLPDDFFYPFLSHASSVNCHTYLVLLLATLIGWNCC